MKKLDQLVLRTFLALFVLTFLVGFFLILMQFFLLRFDDFIGKGIGWSIYFQLSSYVGMVAVKEAFPLAILLASLMSMGQMSEHHELTAMKSAGVSLPRVLQPLFFLTCFLTLLAWGVNSYLVPRAYLNASSLVYDLGKKKPTLALKEGVFYDGIPGYSIKVNKKLEGQSLQGVMIYDHTDKEGRVALTMAKSGRLYTIDNEAYLVIELFDGHDYREVSALGSTTAPHPAQASQFFRSSFKTQKLTLSLASFQLSRTEQERFRGSARTKNATQLAADLALLKRKIQQRRQSLTAEGLQMAASSDAASTPLPEKANILALKALAEQDQQGTYEAAEAGAIYKEALDHAQHFWDRLAHSLREINRLEQDRRKNELAWHNTWAWSLACLVAFFIGAPLGALIKRGGLGTPVLLAAALLVWHYIFEMLGEKWASAEVIRPILGAWLPNLALLPFGIFFFIQAYYDTHLLEADFYAVLLEHVKKYSARIRAAFKRPGSR